MDKAIICDIDGTIALRTGDRSPYDWGRVGEDDVNDPIVKILNGFCYDWYSIILVSGRDAVCRDRTEMWLPSWYKKIKLFLKK